MKVLFTYLVAFSGNGGIQKFNRCFINALYDLHTENKLSLTISSPYDAEVDERYVSKNLFKVGNNKAFFTIYTLLTAFRYDVIILGHINLASIGLLIKLFFPKKKLILIAHGIEVWQSVSFFGKQIIKKSHKILAVSAYTKEILCVKHAVPEENIIIFHNTIDPNFTFPFEFEKPNYLIDRYGITDKNKVVITIARLSSTEKYKGYDQVIQAIAKLKNKDILYLIGGKYDEAEKQRLELIIKVNKLEDNVLLTGYVNDFELTDHYLLADLFIMPSKKEGFGIVFIEAMACGLQVIAGNKDGSVDALRNGELGYLINPDDNDEISATIEKALNFPFKHDHKRILQDKVIEYFGYKAYKNRLENIFNTI